MTSHAAADSAAYVQRLRSALLAQAYICMLRQAQLCLLQMCYVLVECRPWHHLGSSHQGRKSMQSSCTQPCPHSSFRHSPSTWMPSTGLYPPGLQTPAAVCRSDVGPAAAAARRYGQPDIWPESAASALLHSSTPVAVRATKFFLGQDDLEEDEEADEDEGGLDVAPPSKADVYKANNKVRLRACRR